MDAGGASTGLTDTGLADTGLTQQQRASLQRIREREETAFRQRVPRSLELAAEASQVMPAGVPMAWMAGFYRMPPPWIASGSGAAFTDVDGNRYTDFNVCDMSAILGYANPRLTRVISEQAARGVQFLLPEQAALTVCEQLRLRFGLRHWQFTLSASTANAEALRTARFATGRQGVLLFAGKYHGHLDETLWTRNGSSGKPGPVPEELVPEELGVTPPPAAQAVVDFNDLAAAERVLAREQTAAVLIEGVLTNCGTVLPEPGFLDGLREACTRHGTLLVLDETHTQFDCYGGVAACYGVRPDIVTGGKGIAGGIPVGAWGMTAELASLLAGHVADELGMTEGVALGGTLFANALSLASAAVVLTELMTPADYDRMTALGGRLADGIEAAAREHGLDWHAHRFGARTGYCLGPQLPRTAAEAYLSLDPLFCDTRRAYLANRGIWDAISSSGPHPGFAHEPADIDRYLDVLDDFLTEMCT